MTIAKTMKTAATVDTEVSLSRFLLDLLIMDLVRPQLKKEPKVVNGREVIPTNDRPSVTARDKMKRVSNRSAMKSGWLKERATSSVRN